MWINCREPRVGPTHIPEKISLIFELREKVYLAYLKAGKRLDCTSKVPDSYEEKIAGKSYEEASLKTLN